MARILVTGGTGFLGSHIAARLLEDGHEVAFLVRAVHGASAAARVQRVMEWHQVSEDAWRRVQVVEGDLAAEAIGLRPDDRSRLCRDMDEIVHCASDTSFAERKRPLLERVNLGGLASILELASQMQRLTAFHHLSTAYAVGRREGSCREEWPDAASTFHNAYEETKGRGELMVRARCSESASRMIVYRPSIVYGHSRTGRSLLFKALYHPVRAAVMLRNAYIEDLQAAGNKAREAGVRLAPDGTLHMPMRIEAEGLGVDLVPVDYVTDAFAAIRASAGSEGIYHIVAGRPTALADIVAFTSRMFGMSGMRTAVAADMAKRPASVLEVAFHRMIEVYRPYLSDRRVFATDRSGPVLGRAGVRCPPLTYDVFHRCMSFAIASHWGAHRT